MFILTRLLSNLYEKTIIFQYKFPKFMPRCSILQNIGMSNLVILKWRYFEYKEKFEKKKKIASFLFVIKIFKFLSWLFGHVEKTA